MKAIVIGCGRWGSFIAWYMDKIGIEVTMYGRNSSNNFINLKKNRKNDYLQLSEKIKFVSDTSNMLENDLIVIAIPAQSLSQFARKMRDTNIRNKTILLCMKGTDIVTGDRLSVLVENAIDKSNNVAVWLGPGHPQNFVKGIPNCMVIDSSNNKVKKELAEVLTSPLIRFYYGSDLIGNEIGAATKNVMGIAAGMLDGIGYGSLKGALMSRGTKEVSRLIVKLGGKADTVYGLGHLGDYEATIFSEYSHNRQFGENYIKGKAYDKLAEGYFTVKAVMKLSEKHNVSMPICSAVYDILYNDKNVYDVLNNLLQRDIKEESC